jgi:hypothetical protein
MSIQKSLSLAHRFEPPHVPFPYSGRLMGLLCSIIFILLSTVDRIGNQLKKRYTITFAIYPSRSYGVSLHDCAIAS